MADKMTCPGCNSHTSAVLGAFTEGRPCPYCGLSHGAAAEILAVRKTAADETLKARLEQVIKERDAALAEAGKLRYKLAGVERALSAGPPDLS